LLATRLGRQGRRAQRQCGEKAANAAVRMRTWQRPRTARRLCTERGFGPGWRGGRARQGVWSVSDSAAVRLTERRRRRLRADTVGTASRWPRHRTVQHGHGRRCGQDGRVVGMAAREARRGKWLSGGGQRSEHGRSGALLIQHVHVRTVPPMATNQGMVHCDTATDRWAPHVSIFPK
jgi:hypothetical protein